jgi:hypothetical protein
MTQVILVPALRLEAASGTTLYPGENGFSSVWGEVESDAPALTDTLDQKVVDGVAVSLRCGMLEVTGQLREHELKDGRRHYRILVREIRYGYGDTTAHVA